MNKKYIVRLMGEERRQLTELISKGKTSAQKIKHANILLKADATEQGWSDQMIAKAFKVNVNTVCGIRQRYVFEGLESALNRRKQSHPSQQRILDGEKEARLIALSCSQPPEGYARWTLRLLADKIVQLGVVENISYETVRRELKKTS
jgi:transposase